MTCCQFSILYRHVVRINIEGLLLPKPVHRTAIIRQVVCQLLLYFRKQWGAKGTRTLDPVTFKHAPSYHTLKRRSIP
jgi:hypothetical protein